jgi:aminoglycoside 6'-N-acetyltransferase I
MIRTARPEDYTELRRLWLALFPWDNDDAERAIKSLVSGEQRAALIVSERPLGSLSGFIEVGTRPYAEGCVTSPVAYIEAWYVDADDRRRGIGRALFAAAEQWGRDQGLREIASDALIENETSIIAHKALGYEEIERIVCFRRDI